MRKVSIGEPVYFIRWVSLPPDAKVEVHVSNNVGDSAVLNTAKFRITKRFIEYQVPADFVNEDNLPLTISLHVNGKKIHSNRIEAAPRSRKTETEYPIAH